MAQSGYIGLINGTKYDWNAACEREVFPRYPLCNVERTNQPDDLGFPDIVPAGKYIRVNVKWDGNDHSKSVNAGEAFYTLGDTNVSFKVQSSVRPNGFSLGVQFTNLETPGNPVGSTLNSERVHDGCVAFILAGEQGKFTSSILPSESWMQDNLNVLGEKSLMHLCMPGSHDSGMSTFGAHTAFATENNTLTQTKTILGQLQLGARYFDIRPVISGGEYFTGHYSNIGIDQKGSKINITGQGANGQSIPSIIKEINDFSATNKELIILYFSHDFNTDVGNASYRPFTQDEWNSLLEMLKGVNSLFVAPNPSTVDLTKQKLSTFIGKNNAAVLIVIRPSNGIHLGPYANQGFYLPKDFLVYDKYTGTNELDTMVKDQLKKLQDERPNPDKTYFLLSWTLTQSAPQATVYRTSILELANQANPQMYDSLLSRCSSKSYPNILFIDNFCDSNTTALAMAINVCF